MSRSPSSSRSHSRRWVRHPPSRWPGEVASLERELRESIRGEVAFDAGSRGAYACDGSNYRQTPIGVVWPRDAADVERVIDVCRRAAAPILGRGGGTSLAGQCCNLAVVMDFSMYMNGILEIDTRSATATVEPGCVLDDLRAAANAYDLTFGPDPSTHTHCTLGGMIGNDSCGVHSVMAGRTADNVRALEVVTYDGCRMWVGPTSDAELERILARGDRRAEIHRRLLSLRDRHADVIRSSFPRIPRRVSGYNLDALLPENGFDVARALVGSEGTCATTVRAKLRLVEWPRHRVLLVLGFDDAYVAADHVPDLLERAPIGLEGIDRRLIEDMRKKGLRTDELGLLPEGHGWLLAEFGGDSACEAVDRARGALSRMPRATLRGHRLLECPTEQARVWKIRESGLGATARVPGEGDTWPGWEDSAVPPEKLGAYMRELRDVLDRYGYEGAFYGHYGDGCLHTRITFDLITHGGVERYREFVGEAADLVTRYGGSLSGEHGDGQSRAELLPRMYGAELCEAFREFKEIWDPGHRMNPGKGASGPYAIRDALRLGPRYRPRDPETHFAYREDQGSFARATLRCVGVGKCRATQSGIMCPSFMATRQERHSTRGRARLLNEMLRDGPVSGGWRSDAVREALDLCLACKACKNECPVNVDMATYKAEFLAHHYRWRLRPRAAYAMGLIPWWARLGARIPSIANGVLQREWLGRRVKRLAGIDPRRSMPRFALQPFHRSFRAEAGRASDRSSARGTRSAPTSARTRRVLLFPDTFNNFFHPQTLHAATRVLVAAGCEVHIPRRIQCCGRPLYDFGMLDLARHQLRRILDDLAPEIEAGTPVIGLEPSCVATFRDELPALLPRDLHAQRLSRQTHTLAEYLRCDAALRISRSLHGEALFQHHCHQQSVIGTDADVELVRSTGLQVEVLDSGCCGMAGSFGFEAGTKYELSQQLGERRLFPAVRAAPEAYVLADGFSCRTQIEQGTGRRALHLAEVLDRALGG